MTYEKHRHHLLMKYPAISDLEHRAGKRIPHVGWEYLQSGTGSEELVQKNMDAFQQVSLTPQFCKGELIPNITTTLFGRTYGAPFGIAPVGLTGLMWPRAEVIMAKTANKYQIPFCLSTAATETPETVGPHVGNMGWFQLYPPRESELRTKLLDRAREAGFNTLVITADVPMPSRRERTKRAGLRTPPRITPRFIWQGITHPAWAFGTLKNGLPRLRTMESYSTLRTLMSVESFVSNNLGGNLSWEHCREIREAWQGPIILKGLLHPEDARRAVDLGLDGIVVSNHGGRQFNGAPTSIEALPEIVRAVGGRTTILLDSGIRSGLDILRALSLGADFVLLGRAFLYGIGALGNYGSDHVVEILKGDLENNMVNLGIASLQALRAPAGSEI